MDWEPEIKDSGYLPKKGKPTEETVCYKIGGTYYDCLILGKRTVKRVSCVGGYQPASAVSVVLISMYSAILRNSSANLK